MNKRFVLGDNLFFFDGHYYAVDKAAEIKRGDWYWAFSAQAGIGYKYFKCGDEYHMSMLCLAQRFTAKNFSTP